MTWILSNGQLMPAHQWKISPLDRAFRYGEALFESVMAVNGRMPLWDMHWERMEKGRQLLGLSIDEKISIQSIENQIFELLEQNHLLNKIARIRWQVWRKEGGLYTPETNDWNYLIEAEEGTIQFFPKRGIGISDTVRLHPSPWSALKTSQVLPQVLASLERKKRGLDDLILLSQAGDIAECISSNLFWMKEGIYYTPSLETGCRAGVMREFLIRKMKSKNLEIREIMKKPEVILQADRLFASNVAGISPIGAMGTLSFPTSPGEEADWVRALYGI
jgi:4-amino-4-deoxychorismate lyase